MNLKWIETYCHKYNHFLYPNENTFLPTICLTISKPNQVFKSLKIDFFKKQQHFAPTSIGYSCFNRLSNSFSQTVGQSISNTNHLLLPQDEAISLQHLLWFYTTYAGMGRASHLKYITFSWGMNYTRCCVLPWKMRTTELMDEWSGLP